MAAVTEKASGMDTVSAQGPGDAVLQSVLASARFQRAPALSRLLVYLWEHRPEPPGEYAIAVDALGKRADFDPKMDATVRVHVARLRQKLREFFENEGLDSPVQLTIPAGAYRIEVHAGNAAVSQPTPAGGNRHARWLWVAFTAAAVVCVVSSVMALLLWRENRDLRRQTEAAGRSAAANVPDFWRRTLGNGKLTRLVFPTPVFFQTGKLRIRDVTINDPAASSQSPALKALGLGRMALSQSYSVTSDTLAVATLSRLLTGGGLPISVNATRDLSLELFGSDNLVFMGIPPTTPHVDQLTARTEFWVAPDTQAVRVRHPRAGESAEYRDQPGKSLRYGIVAVLPGQAAGTRLVLLCGLSTSCLASFTASPVTLRQLDEYLRQQGSPKFFEMVVEAEVDGFKLLRGRPAAFRVVPATLWK